MHNNGAVVFTMLSGGPAKICALLGTTTPPETGCAWPAPRKCYPVLICKEPEGQGAVRGAQALSTVGRHFGAVLSLRVQANAKRWMSYKMLLVVTARRGGGNSSRNVRLGFVEMSY